MEKLFNALKCPEEWRVGFVMFYLMDIAHPCWATMQERQYDLGFYWKRFKELIKDHFYPCRLRRQRRMNSYNWNKGE